VAGDLRELKQSIREWLARRGEVEISFQENGFLHAYKHNVQFHCKLIVYNFHREPVLIIPVRGAHSAIPCFSGEYPNLRWIIEEKDGYLEIFDKKKGNRERFPGLKDCDFGQHLNPLWFFLVAIGSAALLWLILR